MSADHPNHSRNRWVESVERDNLSITVVIDHIEDYRAQGMEWPPTATLEMFARSQPWTRWRYTGNLYEDGNTTGKSRLVTRAPAEYQPLVQIAVDRLNERWYKYLERES